jgi:hypothetical protein
MCPFVLFTGRGQEPNAALLHHHNQRQVGSRPVELVRGRCKHSDSDSASAAVGRSAQKLMSYGGEEDDGRGDPARPSGHSPLATRHTHTPSAFPFLRPNALPACAVPIRSSSPSPYARLALPAQQTPSNGVAISMRGSAVEQSSGFSHHRVSDRITLALRPTPSVQAIGCTSGEVRCA